VLPEWPILINLDGGYGRTDQRDMFPLGAQGVTGSREKEGAMRLRHVVGLALSATLLLVAAGSGLARGSELGGLSEAAGATSSLAAHTPWFIETVTRLATLASMLP
jgi:hypothetical protein